MPPKKKTTTARKSTTPPRAAGGGGRSGRKPPPPITVGKPKPWGLIALTLVVVLFAGLVIGYAVFEAQQVQPEHARGQGRRTRRRSRASC